MLNENKPDQLTSHEYDGIKEYNNPLPRWWLVTFYTTIFFGFSYWGYYHVLGAGLMPAQALAIENSIAEKKLSLIASSITEDKLVSMGKDPQKIEMGKTTFAQNCAPCHGDKGQGVIGPNLTDSAWIHGSSAMEIRNSISKGVLEKGMPAWQSVLGDRKINELVAFILSIQNTNLPGKEPQGTVH